MTCQRCGHTMSLWTDNKYHCPHCGKVVKRPDVEFIHQKLVNCFGCDDLFETKPTPGKADWWCNKHQVEIFDPSNAGCK